MLGRKNVFFDKEPVYIHPPASATPRTGDHLKYPAWMEAMRSTFEFAMKRAFQSMAEGGISRNNFWLAHRAALALLSPDEHWQSCFAAADVVVDAPDALDAVCTTDVGKAMFEGEKLRSHRTKYTRSMTERLKDVLHHDYDEAVVRSFKEAMALESRNLVSLGVNRFETVELSCDFLAPQLKIYPDSTDDEYEIRLAAGIKLAALNGGNLRFTPWEKVLFNVGEVPGAPCAVTVPDCFLIKTKACRDSVWPIIGEEKTTLKEVIRLIKPKASKLCKCDGTFQLELEFLYRHALPMLREKVDARLLQPLPTEDDDGDLKQAIGNCPPQLKTPSGIKRSNVR